MRILTTGQYYGSKRTDWRANGLVLSEYDYYDPRTDWHYHENPYFMYVLQGDMHDINHRGRTAIGRGSLVFHNWQEPHQNTKESETGRGFHIELERNWFDEKKLDIGLWEGSQVIDSPRLHNVLARLYMEFHLQDSFSGIAMELLLLSICEGLEEGSGHIEKHRPPWVDKLKELIWDNTENLSLASLSTTLGVHPAHLSRAIPKYLHINLGEYIRQQKIKRSLPYLLDPSMSLTEIAFALGFADQSHFTRTFKRYCGQSPKIFRRTGLLE
ncbi:MAG: helix-turn-helix transcriptional regulator [Bacteroidia bacterium]